MKKKINTLLFMACATVLNLALLSVTVMLFIIVFGVVFQNLPEVSKGLSFFAIIVVLAGSLGVTFVVYSKIVRWAMKKWNLDKYMEPLLKGRL